MNDRASRPAASSAIGKPRKAFGQSQSSRRSRTEAARDAVDQRLDEVIAVLNVQQGHAEDGAVRRDEGQVDAQRLIQRGDGLLQEHLDELHKGGDDEDEHDGLHVHEFQRHEQELVDGPGGRRGDAHDERDGEAHAGGGVDLARAAEERAAAEELREDEVIRQHGAEDDGKNTGRRTHVMPPPFPALRALFPWLPSSRRTCAARTA